MWSDKYLLQYLKKTMLKLSSPLRPDQNQDGNKENILAGEDVSKVKSEVLSPCIPSTEFCFPRDQSTPIRTDDSTIKDAEVNKLEGKWPVFATLKNSSLLLETENSESSSSSTENNCFVRNSNNSEQTIINRGYCNDRLNVFNQAEEDSPPPSEKTNCKQPTCDDITNSTYDKDEDSIDVIKKTVNLSEEQISVEKCPKSEINLNSTYPIGENIESESTFLDCEEFIQPKCESDHLVNVTIVISDADGSNIEEPIEPIHNKFEQLTVCTENQEVVSVTLNEYEPQDKINSNVILTEKQIEEVQICQKVNLVDNDTDENLDIGFEKTTSECVVDDKHFPNLSASEIQNSGAEETDKKEKSISCDGVLAYKNDQCENLEVSSVLNEETSESTVLEQPVLTNASNQTLSVISQVYEQTQQLQENIEEPDNLNSAELADKTIENHLEFLDATEYAADSSLSDIEKSTVVLVSDSSANSFDKCSGSPNTSKTPPTSKYPATQVSPVHKCTESDSDKNQSISVTVNPDISTEQNIPSEPASISGQLYNSLESDIEVVNKSSSAFIVLSCPNTEDNVPAAVTPNRSLCEKLENNCIFPSIEANKLNVSTELKSNSIEVNSNLHFDPNKPRELEEECAETLETRISNEKQVDEEIIINKEPYIPNKSPFDLKEMAEINEKLQQENSDLKLELNASKQAKSSLELEIGKKDEIILKTQAESIKKEQQHLQDIKALKEQLKEKSSHCEKDFIKDMEEALKAAKTKESQALSELNARINDELNYRKIMEEYEKTIAARIADSQKLKEENETVTKHLANLELSFSDLHQKYERTKAIIDGFKTNEEKLRKKFVLFEETIHKQEEKYESLKAHARAQIEKSNKEIILHKEKYDSEVSKLNAIIKRLEIKSAALETSLEQKTNECIALSALCDEVTGKKV